MGYKVREISVEEYENFNHEIPTYSLFQTSDYSFSRRANYDDVKLLGLTRDGKIVGTTQLLIESLPIFNLKLGTSIKGVNIDFENEEILRNFFVEMKSYLKRNKFLSFRFDLPIALEVMNSKFEKYSEEELKEMNFTFPYDPDIQTKLEKAGFQEFFIDENYMGRSPQYSMLVDTKTEEKIYSQMNRSVRRGIKTTKKYGVQIETIEDALEYDEDGHCYLEIFYELHQKNADINNINIHPLDYYKRLFQSTKDVKLFLVSVDTEEFMEITRKELEENDTEKNQRLFDLAVSKYEEKNELNERNKKIYFIAHVSGFYNKTGYDLFTGLDYDFRELGGKDALMEHIFLYSNQIGVDYYDFWGILGRIDDDDPMMPIFNFKKKFSNIVVRYPGFWDIPTNKLLYSLFKLRAKRNYKSRH